MRKHTKRFRNKAILRYYQWHRLFALRRIARNSSGPFTSGLPTRRPTGQPTDTDGASSMARNRSERDSVAVYFLYDPAEPSSMRYVGSTVDPKSRLRQHRLRKSLTGRKCLDWIRYLHESGRQPQMKIVGWYEPKEAAETELRLYHELAPSGTLVNATTPRRKGQWHLYSGIKEITRVVPQPYRNSKCPHLSLPIEWSGRKIRVTLIE